jgi:hypothetical protein
VKGLRIGVTGFLADPKKDELRYHADCSLQASEGVHDLPCYVVCATRRKPCKPFEYVKLYLFRRAG